MPDDKVKNLQELAIDYGEGMAVFRRSQKGEWKATGQTMGLYYVYACNKCGIYNKDKTNFCPNCRAKMQKGGAE